MINNAKDVKGNLKTVQIVLMDLKIHQYAHQKDSVVYFVTNATEKNAVLVPVNLVTCQTVDQVVLKFIQDVIIKEKL